MLQIESLSCFRQDRYLFKDLNATALPGQALQIVGENGSGKTTLFKRLICLDRFIAKRGVFAVTYNCRYLSQAKAFSPKSFAFRTSV